MDGNYGGTLDIRLEKADTFIYLARSTWTCMSRVLCRIRKYRGSTRPDMPVGCPERYDLNFLHYVLTFNLVRRKKILSKLQVYEKTKDIHILKSNKNVDDFLDSIDS